ncbi:hypothetical protein ACLEPN_08935 [Myxococcus sp. 1LA]
MPRSHLMPVASEEPHGAVNAPPSPKPAAPPPREALATSWIDEWGTGPESSFPEAWTARLKASIDSAPDASAEGPSVAISGLPDAWSVGPAASILGAHDAWDSGETTASDAVDAWGMGPDLVTAYALIPAARGLHAAAAAVSVAGAGRANGTRAGTSLQKDVPYRQNVLPGEAPARPGDEATPTWGDGTRRRSE